MNKRLVLNVFRFLTIILLPNIALAYVGPGAGLSAIGTVIALIGAILLGIVGFVWYPVKRLLRGKNSAEVEEPQVNNAEMSAAPDESDTRAEFE